MQMTKDWWCVCAINDIRVVLGGNLEEQTNERFFCVSRQLYVFDI